MTALDADTLRELRNLLAKWQDDQGDRRAITPSDYQQLITALVNAAPALLDAAEAVERIRTLIGPPPPDPHPLVGDDWCLECAVRAALAPPPDRNQP